MIPSVIGYVYKAEKEVCKVNCLQLEQMYETYLVLEGIDHSDSVFNSYIHEKGMGICPDHGGITYMNGKVECSLHSIDDSDEDGENNEDEGDVPFL